MKALTLTLIPLLLLSPCQAENWPVWRGPNGDGTTTASGLPQTWDQEKGVKWKTPLPGPGNSSPVVWGDRIFITQAVEDQRLLLCFDRKTGEEQWRGAIEATREDVTHKTNPPAASSPASDGSHVLAWFGSSGLHCWSVEGELRWSLDLGIQRQVWGYGASPMIADGKAYLNFGPGERQFLVCVDIESGSIVWQHDEPGGSAGDGGRPTWRGSWGVPILREVNGRPELIHTFPGRVCAFDPATGEELWTCSGLNSLIYTSPLFVDGVVLAMGSYRGPSVAVKAGGNGDVTDTHRLWLQDGTRQRIGSAVIHEGHSYILTDDGIAECRRMDDGEIVWEERIKGPGPTAQNWSSVVLTADGLCYAVNQGGDAIVFRASPDFELISINPMGEKIIGSIAVSQGELFIRGHEHLWCISPSH